MLIDIHVHAMACDVSRSMLAGLEEAELGKVLISAAATDARDHALTMQNRRTGWWGARIDPHLSNPTDAIEASLNHAILSWAFGDDPTGPV